MPEQLGRRSGFYELSKHPLLLLLVGTIIGSLVVPYVNRRIEADRRLAVLKTERAGAILQTSRDVEARLNAVMTTMANFYKDLMAGALTGAEGSRLRTQLYRQYEEFDRQAWWWHWQALEECDLLRLLTNETRSTFRHAAHEYQENLRVSTKVLDPGWSLLRLASPQPPDAVAVGQDIEVMLGRSEELGTERQRLVRDMVRAVLQ